LRNWWPAWRRRMVRASRVTGWPCRRSSSRAARAAGKIAARSAVVPGTGLGWPVCRRGRFVPRAMLPGFACIAGRGGSFVPSVRPRVAVTRTGWERSWSLESCRAGSAAELGTVAGLSAAGRCSRMPDRSLTAISRARAGQPAMVRLIVPVSAVAMLAARLAAVPMVRAAQGSQPADRPVRRFGEQDQGCDDLDAVDRQGEGVGVPASVAVGGGEGPHVAVADGAGYSGQPGHGRPGGAADPLVCPRSAGAGRFTVRP
jgi:hypothetical protein